MDHGSILLFVGIGLATGVVAGMFGVGGGLLLIPALVYLAGYTQQQATGHQSGCPLAARRSRSSD